MSQMLAHVSPQISEHSRKRRKRLQKALDADGGAHNSEDRIPYPTGEVPGRGGCQLVDHIGQDKATYNAFAVCPFYSYSPQHARYLIPCRCVSGSPRLPLVSPKLLSGKMCPLSPSQKSSMRY